MQVLSKHPSWIRGPDSPPSAKSQNALRG